MAFSFLFYSAVTWMINGPKDIHFAQFDKYGVMAEPLIDNIMYLQMILGTCLVFYYTYRMDDQFSHETLDYVALESHSTQSFATSKASTIVTQSVASSNR